MLNNANELTDSQIANILSAALATGELSTAKLCRTAHGLLPKNYAQAAVEARLLLKWR